jgi:hypothetical protein
MPRPVTIFPDTVTPEGVEVVGLSDFEQPATRRVEMTRPRRESSVALVRMTNIPQVNGDKPERAVIYPCGI